MMAAKKTKKDEERYIQCIGCRQPCSMSGLCMRMWPEFVEKRRKGVANDDKDGEKNS